LQPKKGRFTRPFFFLMRQLSIIAPALSVLTLLALAWWALAPGLDGGFLFDDYANLPALGEYGGVRDSYTLALYLTSGLGDLTGRPLSVLSFLVDARNWPAAPYPFLRTNILLHLLNGLLLICVLWRLGRACNLAVAHAWHAAVLGAALWLLHPLLLSTTLYIVQREAMLPATFVLLGMLAWIGGRERWQRGDHRSALTLLIIGSIACTTLATLCKANGILLPLLLLITEATVLARTPFNARFARWRGILLGVPVVGIALVFITSAPEWADGAATNRPWTLAQRALTEPRVLLDYVALLAFPRSITQGVFHDNFTASTSWLQPWSTLPALLCVIASIGTGWLLRRRWPLAAFAVLFYFAGHLLESTIVPLELYFEHRNYLPAMTAFWPLAVWLSDPGTSLRRTRAAAAFLCVAMLIFCTHVGASYWGKPEQLALAWAQRNPDSPRAQAYAAQFEMAQGDYAAAEKRLQKALAAYPQQTQLAFNLATAECARGGLRDETFLAMRDAIKRDATAAQLDFVWLRDAIARAQSGTCRGVDLARVESLVQAGRENPFFSGAPGRVQDFDHLQGLIALARGDSNGALAAFDRAADELPKPQIVLEQAALLGSAGHPALGLRHLDGYLVAHPLHPAAFGLGPTALHAWLLDHENYWRAEFTRVRQLLAEKNGTADNAQLPRFFPFRHDG